jgi:hypothetical protein
MTGKRRPRPTNDPLPRLEKIVPEGTTLIALRKAIPLEPRRTRLVLMSTLQVGRLEGLSDPQFNEVLRCLHARDLVPLGDHLTIPQRADKRFKGLAKAPSKILAEIHDHDLMIFPRHRPGILRSLSALASYKRIHPGDLTIGVLQTYSSDDVYDALDSLKTYTEPQIRVSAGSLFSMAERWGVPLS